MLLQNPNYTRKCKHYKYSMIHSITFNAGITLYFHTVLQGRFQRYCIRTRSNRSLSGMCSLCTNPLPRKITILNCIIPNYGNVYLAGCQEDFFRMPFPSLLFMAVFLYIQKILRKAAQVAAETVAFISFT